MVYVRPRSHIETERCRHGTAAEKNAILQLGCVRIIFADRRLPVRGGLSGVRAAQDAEEEGREEEGEGRGRQGEDQPACCCWRAAVRVRRAPKPKTSPLLLRGSGRPLCGGGGCRCLAHTRCGEWCLENERIKLSIQCSSPQSFFAWNMSLVFFCALRPAAREFALSDSDSWAHVPGGMSIPRALFHSSSVM